MRRRVLLIVETAYAYGRAVLRGINDYVVAHQSWSISLDLRGLMMSPPPWLADWDGGAGDLGVDEVFEKIAVVAEAAFGLLGGTGSTGSGAVCSAGTRGSFLGHMGSYDTDCHEQQDSQGHQGLLVQRTLRQTRGNRA